MALLLSHLYWFPVRLIPRLLTTFLANCQRPRSRPGKQPESVLAQVACQCVRVSFLPLTWDVTRGLRVLRKQLFLRLLLTTCRASEYTLDLESCLGTLRQS
jgi:hypothetical protein